MEDEEMGRRETPNLAYPPAFKLEIAKFAQKYSQYAAAKIFSVARRRIFDWMRQIPKLQDLIGNDTFYSLIAISELLFNLFYI